MSGGTRWPLPAAKSRKSGRRIAALWPHEDPGSDRISNQLMFVPPTSSAGESNGQRLKKILIYNGLGSWAPLKPGRDVFTQSRCPVDTCTITSEKAQAADADAILYKDHFVNPGHPRPPRQVRGFHILYWRGSTGSRDRVVSPDYRSWVAGLAFWARRILWHLLDHSGKCRQAEPSKCHDSIRPFSYIFIIHAIICEIGNRMQS